jgi:hypothetical protein
MRLRRKGIFPSILAFWLLALAVAAPVRAFPILPPSLSEMIEEADLIAVAEVREVRKVTVRNRQGGSYVKTVAVLRIQERWKGNRSGTIEVPYLTGVTCPSPPVYRAGEDVLVFLKRTRGGPSAVGWITVGLSYGTLYLDRAELADYREKVGRQVALQAK